MKLNYKEFINIKHTPEIAKFIQIKVLLILITVVWEVLTTCFIVKDNKSYCFGGFGGQPDIFLLNQLPKPIIYHNYKIQGINSKLCGPYCIYIFYLTEKLKYYDTMLKLVFG